MLGDISLNAEYVVYAIKTLSSKAGKPISVMTCLRADWVSALSSLRQTLASLSKLSQPSLRDGLLIFSPPRLRCTATQWAFNFFPSTRSMVKSFFAFAPDFRGTTIDLPGAILNAAQLSTGLNLLGLQPSLFQQVRIRPAFSVSRERRHDD
jgi:hypothetical protein